MFSHSSCPQRAHASNTVVLCEDVEFDRKEENLQLCLSDCKQDVMDLAMSVMYSMLLYLLKGPRQVETSSAAAPPLPENSTVFWRNQLLTSHNTLRMIY